MLIAALTVAGCGQDDGGSGTTGAATTTTVQAVTTAAATVTTTTPDTTVTTPATGTATATATTSATPPPAGAAGPDTAARAAYRRRADAVCRTENAAVRRLNVRANAAIRGAKDDAERLEALVPILHAGLAQQEAGLKRFLAIAPPPADRAVIDRYQATLKRQVGLVTKLLSAARAGDVERYTAVSSESAQLREESRAQARAYGFTQCGSGRSDAE